MTVHVRTEGFRIFLILPRFVIPFGLRLAARFGGDSVSEEEKRLLLSIADAVKKTRRRYHGLELVRVTDEDGTFVSIRL